MSTVLVTGASTGIGRATVERLDRAGWTVWAGVRDESDGDRLAVAGSDRLRAVRIDVTQADSIESARAQIEELGELDAVVNNAGIGIAGPLELLSEDELREQLETNVVGQLAVTKAMLPLLRAARDGRIVFVSSAGGRVAFPFAGAYHASKFALEAIGDSLRIELEPERLHVALVEPAAISSPIWDKAEAWVEKLRERPGAERYADRLDSFEQRLRDADEGGGDPKDVAAVIERALTDPDPKARYPIGIRTRVLGPLRQLVPDAIFDRIAGRAAA
jgi:NAD(P)-dependent dehydrogenase (short-subunit alcohol dehydrogenase family)